MGKASITRAAAAIAYADLSGKQHGWPSAADLWGDLSDPVRREYRDMARAAIAAMQSEAV